MLQPKMHSELELFTTEGALCHSSVQFNHLLKISTEG